jgi:hypothetical protein
VITPDAGYFSAKLGDVTAFPATVFDGSNATLFLGIKIGADAEMAPRQALTSVPFALLSLNALNSTHAVHADTAATATTATNATHATSADSATSATNAGTVTPTGGGCYSTGTSALINAGFVGSKGSFSYNCALANGGSVQALIICAK